VVAVSEKSFTVLGQGGFVEVLRCRFEDGKKIAANEAGIAAGMLFGE